MILPKNNSSLTNHHPSSVPTGSHLDASFMRWSKVELPSGKNHTTWNINNFEYSKSRQLSQSNYEFQAKLVPWKPISFLQIWYFASFGPIETTKTVHLSPHIHSYLRARKEKVKREEVDRRVKESREEYSERFSPESQWVVVEEVIVVVSVFLSFCLSQSSNVCLTFFFWARDPEWDFIKFKMLFNEFSVKKLSLNDMWIFNCLCQIWLTFESAQRKENACTENEKIAETLLINQSQILDGCSSGSCTWRIILRMYL